MIASFTNKGLRKFHETGSTAKLSVQNPERLAAMLDALEGATVASDVNLPGFGFHRLKGKPERYSIWASGNWRITFGFRDGKAIDVDLEDYHGKNSAG